MLTSDFCKWGIQKVCSPSNTSVHLGIGISMLKGMKGMKEVSVEITIRLITAFLWHTYWFTYNLKRVICNLIMFSIKLWVQFMNGVKVLGANVFSLKGNSCSATIHFRTVSKSHNRGRKWVEIKVHKQTKRQKKAVKWVLSWKIFF